MSLPAASNVISLDVGRARRLLQDMIDKPFCVIIFNDDGSVAQGVAKGLDEDTTGVIQMLLEGLQ